MTDESGGPEIEIVRARWDRAQDREAMIAIRQAVFVEEQQVPVEIELDGSDTGCRHLLAFDRRAAPGRAIGTARMSGAGHIGRIAVVPDWRKRRVGARLVAAMIELARDSGFEAVDLDSQTHAVGFYEKLGFAARGDEFMEAGIAHQNMYRPLP